MVVAAGMTIRLMVVIVIARALTMRGSQCATPALPCRPFTSTTDKMSEAGFIQRMHDVGMRLDEQTLRLLSRGFLLCETVCGTPFQPVVQHRQ